MFWIKKIPQRSTSSKTEKKNKKTIDVTRFFFFFFVFGLRVNIQANRNDELSIDTHTQTD